MRANPSLERTSTQKTNNQIPNIMPSEISEFFERYRDAFNALDGNAVAEFYAEPSGIAQGCVYTHWPRRQPVMENMNALCKPYRDSGFIRADFEPNQFIAQGGGLRSCR